MAKKKKDYEAHEAAIQSLLEHASRKGWQIVEEREIDFGYRVVVYDGFTRNNVDFYPSGKILVQGKQGALWDELGRWKEERNTAAAQKTGKVSLPFEDMPPIEKPVSTEQAVRFSILEGETGPRATQGSPPHVLSTPAPTVFPRKDGEPAITAPGSKPTARESIVLGVAGKEDYFGPLVISAIHVDAWAEAQFSMLGIHDGTLLSDELLLAKAEEIRAICPYTLVAIGPRRYNEAFAKVQRQDGVWAWGNVRAIEAMLEKTTCNMVVARQLGDEAIIETALGKKERRIALVQSADSQMDSAVVAANIVAEAEYGRYMDQVARQMGQKLPRGVADQAILAAGREIVARGGKNALGEVAKLHFGVTQKIFL